MSLKCSLFGHAFDDSEVEREREEQGSEVVITIRETETCTRCGTERVVSENKEVTTVETPSDIVGDELEEESANAESGAEAEPEVGAQAATGGGTETTTEDIADAEGAGGVGGTASPDGDENEDEDGSDRSAGATGSDSAGPDTGGSVPEAGVEDPSEDDGVILDAGDDEGVETAEGEEETGDVEGRATGEWPDEDDGGGDDWAPETDRDLGPEDVEPTSEATTVPEGTFYCPECDFSTPVEDSSLRAGDFCPECHRGSLEHRE